MATASHDDPSVSIVVVSYNTRRMTLDCLKSIETEARTTPYEVIVFDNASTDGSAEAVATDFPHLRLIASDVNVGFARANNLAAAEARGRYLLLLNPDTVVLDGAVDRLFAFAQARPEARIWGGRTLFGDGTLNATSCFRQMNLWSLACRVSGVSTLAPGSEWLNPEPYGRWDRGAEREVEIVTGCFLLIERSLWDQLGGFDERFVMFAEEADLCHRARALGARPRVTPDVTIIHYGGASEKSHAERMIRLFRAKMTLIEKQWRGPARPLGQALFLLLPWTRKVATAVLAATSGRAAEAHETWRAVWDRRDEWRFGYPPPPAAREETPRRADLEEVR